jgi:TIR domain
MTHIMLAHAPESQARAAIVARKLGARGYKVSQAVNGYFTPGPLGRRRLAADIDKADCVVVLWSREAAEEPGLHAAALRARAQGKLAFARLDTAAAPAGLRVKAADLSNWVGGEASRSWRDLSGAVRRLSSPPAPATRGAASRPAPARSTPAAEPAAAPKVQENKGGGIRLFLGVALVTLMIGAGAAYYFGAFGHAP